MFELIYACIRTSLNYHRYNYIVPASSARSCLSTQYLERLLRVDELVGDPTCTLGTLSFYIKYYPRLLRYPTAVKQLYYENDAQARKQDEALLIFTDIYSLRVLNSLTLTTCTFRKWCDLSLRFRLSPTAKRQILTGDERKCAEACGP